MIKIFGKIRYHWQPELSWAIIYWSLAFTPLFVGMILLLERLRISRLFIFLVALSLILIILGLHRYFELREEHLRIVSANPFSVQEIEIASITRVEVTYLAIRIFSKEIPNGQVYYMRKWPKKYFVNYLVVHSHFKGEIELVDHLIKLDYFEEYYTKKAKSI
ncbi:EbsA family protein [Streptococcus ruminantium]|nr:EbsA family protein [Streptococcus ruminantium]